jgi:hypothetical protein
MELKLNIYEKRKVIKTYKAESYDIMFGTAEDLIDALNLDGLKTEDNMELIKVASQVVINGFDIIKPLLKDIFEGLTDEELRNTKVSEVAIVIVEVVKFSMNQIAKGSNGKN